jgi:hypothetical protein
MFCPMSIDLLLSLKIKLKVLHMQSMLQVGGLDGVPNNAGLAETGQLAAGIF